jgi:3-hydroxyisobutyrate dehydrogenase-like beta-hydroxyacid dehydrogenase
MTLTIGWIGLGTMGGPMAGHLVRAQHKVQAFNRNAERAERWQQQYKLPCVDSVTAAALGADMVFTCVSNDDALREVAHAAFPHMKPGAVLVDHSTTSARVARELATTAQQHGLHFTDAPISGGQAGAEKGQLAVMAGGEAAIFARIEPVIAAYTKRAKLIGGCGAGQLTKMVNQICVTGVIAGLAEGLFFAEQAGIDTDAMLEVISQGAAQSWQMDNRTHTMLRGEYNFGFSVDLIRKDLDIVLSTAKDFHCELPGVTQINLWYETLQKMGHGNSDTSALLERLRHQKT